MKANSKTLAGKRIAILLTDGFEESEMTEPYKALVKAGAKPFIITPKGSKVRSWLHNRWSKYFKVNYNLGKVKASQFDGIVLPGGVMNPDKLRVDKSAIRFIKHFLDANKPVAAICHGPWTLIETGKVKGLKLTSYHSIKSDLINAGAKWTNKKVVVDGKLVTSRSPDDLPAFNREMLKSYL